MNKLSNNWVKQANYDFEVAKFNAKAGHHALACFLCHESAVKIVTAYIYSKGAEFVWGTSLSDLCEDAMVFDPSFDLVKSIAMLLDKYYIGTRLPSSLPSTAPYEVYDKSDSEKSLEIAKAVFDGVIKRMQQD